MRKGRPHFVLRRTRDSRFDGTITLPARAPGRASGRCADSESMCINLKGARPDSDQMQLLTAQ